MGVVGQRQIRYADMLSCVPLFLDKASNSELRNVSESDDIAIRCY